MISARNRPYANYYIEMVGEEHPSDYSIHHIDSNHENSNILNLVAIPNKIHKQYHHEEKQLFTNIERKNKAGIDYNVFRLTELMHQINQYIDRRNVLLMYNNPNLFIQP